uniref:Uncharacterized protein n=1 Tax=Arundo donax TaxID=35708 RepID=A0A0A9BBD5_ARUDO
MTNTLGRPRCSRSAMMSPTMWKME